MTTAEGEANPHANSAAAGRSGREKSGFSFQSNCVKSESSRMVCFFVVVSPTTELRTLPAPQLLYGLGQKSAFSAYFPHIHFHFCLLLLHFLCVGVVSWHSRLPRYRILSGVEVKKKSDRKIFSAKIGGSLDFWQDRTSSQTVAKHLEKEVVRGADKKL